MKKLYIAIALFVGLNVSMAQTKSSGVVTLNSSMSLQVDMNSATSTETLTLSGPAYRWFAIGFNATSMSNGTDCIYYSTSLVDSVITGQGAPTTDASNEWTVVSNDLLSGTRRLLVLTRNFAGGAGDYTFNYNNNSLNIIWAFGSGTAMTQHSGTARGSSTLGFTLGVDDFTSLENITISPNPSNGIFTISAQLPTDVVAIDVTGKEVFRMLNINNQTTLNLTQLQKGLYLLKLSNELGVTTKTLSNWLKELTKQKNCPFTWENIKTAKIIKPKFLEFIKSEL
jgi:hypothetical protein